MTKRRARGEGSLYQQPNGMWVARVEVPSTDGKRRRAKVSSMKYDEAVKKLRKLLREVDDGTFVASGNTTVAQWCDGWLESIVRARVRPKTFKHYEEAVRLLIKPTVGRHRLSKLTQEHVRQMHRDIQVTSTRNAVKAHQALQKALTDAVREGLLARNVAELVDRPKHLAASRGALTSAQARMLINTAVDAGDQLASRWAFAFYTGARPGEILGLQWDRVDLKSGLADLAWQMQHISKDHGCGADPCGKRPGYCPKARWNLPAGFDKRELTGSLLLTRPKTKAGARVVPLAGPLLAMLRAHRVTTAGQPNPHNLVWHNGGQPIHDRDDRHSWTAACEAAGLARRRTSTDEVSGARSVRHPKVEWEVRPPAPYVSRHTAATLLQEAGVPEDIRMAIMGHSSIVAHRGYLHTEQGPKRAAIAALEAVYGGESVAG